MGRRKVVEITCDRCDKTETQTESEVSAEGVSEFKLELNGKITEYQDLCLRCRATVANYILRLRRDPEARALVQKDSEPTKQPTGISKKGHLAPPQ